MNEEKKLPPYAIAGLVAVIVIAVGFLGYSVLGKPSGGNAAAVAGVAKDIRAPESAPRVPQELIQSQTVSRGAMPNGGMMGGGANKNSGR